MTQSTLLLEINQLQKALLEETPGLETQIIETHISVLLLTGSYVYKFKKPVNFGFLDFTTLQQRQFYCQQELCLNQRLAPQLYLEVVSITCFENRVAINGEGEVIEYAVKMRQFRPDDQLDKLIARGELTPIEVAQLAETVANFHLSLPRVVDSHQYGKPQTIAHYCLDNFRVIEPKAVSQPIAQSIVQLETWTHQELKRLSGALSLRQREGYIRECHGDMHLANLARFEDKIVIFDCIEFNEELRWIDVMNEIAFLLMDLDYQHRTDYARLFLDRYLQRTGDYAGLVLLKFYRVYRCLVRAKVAFLGYSQQLENTQQYHNNHTSLERHIQLAHRYITENNSQCLVITLGLSGSGKSHVTEQLLTHADFIRVRSDVERKRLHDLQALDRTLSGVGHGLYQPNATAKTYQQLAILAEKILQAGYSVIVDATFLKAEQRQFFATLAAQLEVPLVILHCHANIACLQSRIVSRLQKNADPSEATVAVLEQQLLQIEPLTTEEQTAAVVVDTEQPVHPQALVQAIFSRAEILKHLI